MITLKCENCGAMMEQDEKKPLLYCPYCGNAIIRPETEIDLKKYKLEHKEAVRQRKVAENKEADRKRHISIWLCILVLAALAASITVPHWLDNYKLNNLVAQIQEDIRNDRFNEAELKVTTLVPARYGDDNDAYWKQIREDLEEQIKERRR